MFFPQADETQDAFNMSDPSEVNQPHPVLFVQGPGRYIQVPYYLPLPTSHVYPNYAVDPSQTHWYPVPQYGNTPLPNVPPTEDDRMDANSVRNEDQSVMTSFPPPIVGLPASSITNQQHYSTSPCVAQAANVATSDKPREPLPPMRSSFIVGTSRNSRYNDGGVNYEKTKQLPPSSAAAATDRELETINSPSSTLPPANVPITTTPPQPLPQNHHQRNFIPMDPIQYNYPYFSSIGPPHPPPLMTSAQYTTGSPFFFHPSTLPMYHHRVQILNSGPVAVLSSDNGVSPHFSNTAPASAISGAHAMADSSQPLQQQLQQDHLPRPTTPSSATHENDNVVATEDGDGVVLNSNVKENAATVVTANEAAYKNSELLADSAPFEPENHRMAAAAAATTYVPASASADASSLPNAAATVNESVAIANSMVTCDDADRSASNAQNVVSLMNDLNVIDTKQTAAVASSTDAARDEVAVATDKVNSHDSDDVDNLSSNSETDAKTADFSTAPSSGSTSVSWNATNATSAVAGDHANVNGKTNSTDTVPASGYESATKNVSAPSETKSASGNGPVIEEQAPVAPNPNNSKKSWASLFKEPASTAKSKVSSRPPQSSVSSLSSSSSTSSSSSSTSIGASSARNASGADLHNSTMSPATAASSSSVGPQHHGAEASNKSSLNGMPPPSAISVHRGKQSGGFKLSAPSLADDTVLPKIGESLKNYKLDHRAVNIEPRGLENKSNYCYINAILQALLACPPFYNLMKFISHNLHHHKTKLATKQHLPIIDSVVQFVEEFKLVPQKARRDKTRKLDSTPQEIVPGKPFEPVYMYNMLSVIQNNSSFVMGQQEDAQEFLTCLLNGLNDEMVELIQLAEGTSSGTNNSRKSQHLSAKATPPVSKNAKKISNGDIANDVVAPDDSDSEWKQVHPKIKPHRPNLALTRTPLSDIFRGQMRSVLAKIGDQCTSSIEPFFTLHLNIEKVNSVKQALELLPGRDNLEGVTSSRTNQEVDAYQQQYLEELPYVLLLHLKYFDYKHHTCRKIKKSIEFPIDLKLDLKLISTQSPSHPKSAPSKSRQYKLFAVVYHDGNEATKGHYITDVFHIGYGGWVRYDDARVWTVSENEVLKPDLPRVPYLLYYRRCDTIAALMQPPFEKRM